MVEVDDLLIIDGKAHRVVAVDERRFTAIRHENVGDTKKSVTVTGGLHDLVDMGEKSWGLRARIDTPKVNPAAVQAKPAKAVP